MRGCFSVVLSVIATFGTCILSHALYIKRSVNAAS